MHMRVRIINIGRFLLCSMLLLGLISPLGSPANTQALASSAERRPVASGRGAAGCGRLVSGRANERLEPSGIAHV